MSSRVQIDFSRQEKHISFSPIIHWQGFQINTKLHLHLLRTCSRHTVVWLHHKHVQLFTCVILQREHIRSDICLLVWLQCQHEGNSWNALVEVRLLAADRWELCCKRSWHFVISSLTSELIGHSSCVRGLNTGMSTAFDSAATTSSFASFTTLPKATRPSLTTSLINNKARASSKCACACDLKDTYHVIVLCRSCTCHTAYVVYITYVVRIHLSYTRFTQNTLKCQITYIIMGVRRHVVDENYDSFLCHSDVWCQRVQGATAYVQFHLNIMMLRMFDKSAPMGSIGHIELDSSVFKILAAASK